MLLQPHLIAWYITSTWNVYGWAYWFFIYLWFSKVTHLGPSSKKPSNNHLVSASLHQKVSNLYWFNLNVVRQYEQYFSYSQQHISNRLPLKHSCIMTQQHISNRLPLNHSCILTWCSINYIPNIFIVLILKFVDCLYIIIQS